VGNGGRRAVGEAQRRGRESQRRGLDLRARRVDYLAAPRAAVGGQS